MIRALEQIRRMRGGAQSHLMRCSDGHYYVVKFQNNPQHPRVLVNEMLGTELALRLGLPTTPVMNQLLAYMDLSHWCPSLTGITLTGAADNPSESDPCKRGTDSSDARSMYRDVETANTLPSRSAVWLSIPGRSAQ